MNGLNIVRKILAEEIITFFAIQYILSLPGIGSLKKFHQMQVRWDKQLFDHSLHSKRPSSIYNYIFVKNNLSHPVENTGSMCKQQFTRWYTDNYKKFQMYNIFSKLLFSFSYFRSSLSS